MHFECKRNKNNLLNNKKRRNLYIYIYVTISCSFVTKEYIYIYIHEEGTKQEKEKSKEKQIILCRQNCTRLLVTLGDRNYRALIGDGLRIFIFVNETLTRNFRRILTSLSLSLSLFSPSLILFHGGKHLKMKHV